MEQIRQATGKTYLSVREAAVYTGYSVGYIYKLVKDRAIPFHTPNGGRIIFSRLELDEWITDAKGGKEPDKNTECLVIR
jgi:excisionase family DNA binding protein